MANTLFDASELGDAISAFEQLLRLVPPPISVEVVTPDQWLGLEKVLRLRLPQDFKQFINAYGNGYFASFLWVYNPFYSWKNQNSEASYLIWVNERLTGLKEGHRTYPEYMVPFMPFPANNGLLPWGFTDNGDTLCWQTEGEPDKWPLILIDSKTSEHYDTFHFTMTEFLVHWLRQDIEPTIFPINILPAKEPVFRQVNGE